MGTRIFLLTSILYIIQLTNGYYPDCKPTTMVDSDPSRPQKFVFIVDHNSMDDTKIEKTLFLQKAVSCGVPSEDYLPMKSLHLFANKKIISSDWTPSRSFPQTQEKLLKEAKDEQKGDKSISACDSLETALDSLIEENIQVVTNVFFVIDGEAMNECSNNKIQQKIRRAKRSLTLQPAQVGMGQWKESAIAIANWTVIDTDLSSLVRVRNGFKKFSAMLEVVKNFSFFLKDLVESNFTTTLESTETTTPLETTVTTTPLETTVTTTPLETTVTTTPWETTETTTHLVYVREKKSSNGSTEDIENNGTTPISDDDVIYNTTINDYTFNTTEEVFKPSLSLTTSEDNSFNTTETDYNSDADFNSSLSERVFADNGFNSTDETFSTSTSENESSVLDAIGQIYRKDDTLTTETEISSHVTASSGVSTTPEIVNVVGAATKAANGFQVKTAESTLLQEYFWIVVAFAAVFILFMFIFVCCCFMKVTAKNKKNKEKKSHSSHSEKSGLETVDKKNKKVKPPSAEGTEKTPLLDASHSEQQPDPYNDGGAAGPKPPSPTAPGAAKSEAEPEPKPLETPRPSESKLETNSGTYFTPMDQLPPRKK